MRFQHIQAVGSQWSYSDLSQIAIIKIITHVICSNLGIMFTVKEDDSNSTHTNTHTRKDNNTIN